MNIEKSSMKMMIAMMTILLAMTMNAYNDFRPLLGGWPIPVPDQGNVEKVKTCLYTDTHNGYDYDNAVINGPP